MANKLTQREKIRIAAEEQLSEGRPFVKDFIDAFLSMEDTREDLLDYLYNSDFLTFMEEKNYDFCKKLLNDHASTDWFKLIHTVYDEETDERDKSKKSSKVRDPDRFCAEFEVYYGLGIDIELLREVYESCTSVSDLREKMKPFIHVSGDIDVTEGIPLEDKYSAAPVKAIVEQNTEKNMLKKRLIELEEQNRMLKVSLEETNEQKQKALLGANEEKQALHDELWKLRLEIQHLKDTRVESDGAELRRAKLLLKQSEERVAVVEEMKRNLIMENDDLQKNLNDLKQDHQKVEEALMAQRERAEQTDMKLSEVSSDLIDARNYVAGLEGKIEELQKALEAERTKENITDLSTTVGTPEEELLSEDLSDSTDEEEPAADIDRIGGVIRIADATSQIRKKSNVFMRLYSKFQERMFEQKPKSEQNNLLLLKMMNLNFSPERVKKVKACINADGSLLELYKMVTRDAPDDEFDQYCVSLGPAA